jgi:uncharacterized protein GlcG (DUF336 family)
MRTLIRSTAVFALLATTSIALAQGPGRGRGGPPPEPSLLSYEQAAAMMAAAEKFTNDKGWAMSIRIVDQNNNVLMLHRLNEVNPFTINVTDMKTTTVTATKMSSAAYAEKLAAGEIEEVEGGANFGGGVPVYVGGQFIGAIAASGGRPEEDEQVAIAGVEAIGGSISMN